MQAVTRRRYGAPLRVVHVEDVPIPEPGPDEVLIRVQAAGLDRGVLHLVEGTPYALRLVFGLRRPKRPVLGLDLAGVVHTAGAASGFAAGDEVLGIGTGALAEYAVAPAAKIVRRPAGVGITDAAALPISGLTALQAVEAADVRPGHRVVVLGASGGVGTFAVQLAAARGAEVIGVCSAGKSADVKGLGAQQVLDYEHDELPQDADVVLAIGGNLPVRHLRRCLTRGGTLLVIGGEGGGQILGIGRQLRAVASNPFVPEHLAMLVSRESGADLQRLVDLVSAAAVTPLVGARYRLEDAPQALADLEAGRITGKAVFEVAP